MTSIKYTVLNPQGQPLQSKERLPLAPRLDSLDGKTIALVDVGFGGGYEFREQMQGWFARHLPATKTVLVRKPGNMLTNYSIDRGAHCRASIFTFQSDLLKENL